MGRVEEEGGGGGKNKVPMGTSILLALGSGLGGVSSGGASRDNCSVWTGPCTSCPFSILMLICYIN